MDKLKKNSTIIIYARRWFQKSYGNTYHSCYVYVNGTLIGENTFTYGYGSQYLQTARAILEKNYKLPLNPSAPLWQLKEKGIGIIEHVSDVARKKDL